MDQTIRAWEWRAGQVHAVWPVADQVYSLAVSSDGQTLAAAHKGGIVTLWDVAQAKARPALGRAGDVLGLAFSPDGLTLALARRDRTGPSAAGTRSPLRS
jgi:WD40 repeat protein